MDWGRAFYLPAPLLTKEEKQDGTGNQPGPS